MRTILSLFLSFIAIAVGAQLSKQVFVTLDVSGSMSGNKYVLANYTTQMIVTLCDTDDDVHLIVYGRDNELSKGKESLSMIQRPMYNFGPGSAMSSQFNDIIGFNNLYTPSKDKQNWLFIIGDGVWETGNSSYKKDAQRFTDIVKGGSLQVCYLQTSDKLSESSDFTEFVKGLGVVDIKKSSTDPKTIQEGCDHFARKILGFSNTPLDIKKDGAKGITVECELPVKELIVVYQDETVPGLLPSITAAESNGKKLDVHHKGTPTTKPVKANTDEKDLSGNVWRIKSGSPISANTPIAIAFDKEVNIKKISIYPLVGEMEFGGQVIVPGGNAKTLNDHTFAICKDNKKAQVRIELSNQSKGRIPEPLLERTKVVVKSNNKDYTASYKNGGFECLIDLDGDTTQYYAECDCPGYFTRVTPIMTIVREKCEPIETEKVLPEVDFGKRTYHQLMIDPIEGSIYDANTLETLDPSKFDIDIEVDEAFMYEKPAIRIEGNRILMDVKPKGDWCECLFPTDLNIKITSTPKDGAFGDKNYVKTIVPIHLEIVKDTPWLSRCLWVLVALVALLFFMFYLRSLMKKKRFKKNAMLTPKYYSYYGDLIDDQGGRKLRKDGFLAWVARWFLPGDERITLSVDKPVVDNLTILASESRDVVRILKSSCDWDTMELVGYDPETDMGKSKTVNLGDMGIIEVSLHNGSKEGELVFTSGSEDDGAGYRIFLGLLMGASMLTFIALVAMMLRSI